MGCGCDNGKGKGCACSNKIMFNCVSCQKKETFKTNETGYRSLAHLIAQATEKGWADYEDILINGELCAECSDFVDKRNMAVLGEN